MATPTNTPKLPDVLYDSEYALLAKIANNLLFLFNFMSNNQWKGSYINATGDGCICSTKDILANIASNLWSFFYWLAANGLPPSTQYDQAGKLAATLGTSSQAIVFATAFTVVPAVVCNLVPPDGGDIITAVPVTVTTGGFTANWGFAVPAGYTISWGALLPTQ